MFNTLSVVKDVGVLSLVASQKDSILVGNNEETLIISRRDVQDKRVIFNDCSFGAKLKTVLVG